ncbi:DUF308 domain-containing protein [Glutamicibacter sp.]|uniref:HdeD family acid-resistance protein n=1 Tax=Glutamicibacter sp. TaxID=1931995 RepID=UPI0028BD356F|nr:DUF308 domain-containing protein [Glutamicibacter sp.]
MQQTIVYGVDTEIPRSVTSRLVNGLLIRGIIALILGVLILFFPKAAGATLSWVIVILLAAWLVLDGITSLITGIAKKKAKVKGAGWTITGGVVAIIAGICAVIFPYFITAFGGLIIMWFVALGLVIRGALEIGDSNGGTWQKILGIINILVGVALVVVIITNPATALVVLMWIIGFYGIVFGLICLIGSFAFRSALKHVDHQHEVIEGTFED